MNPLLAAQLESLRNRIAADPDLAGRDLVSLVRPSVRLQAEKVPLSRLRLGESRIGGLPDVPLDFDWPRWSPSQRRMDRCGEPWRPDHPMPLGFIAQIELQALPQVDSLLPDAGWLYFFYDRNCEPWGFDPADRGCCRVVYASSERSSLTRVEPPADLDREFVAEACRVDPRPELTLPDDLPDLDIGTSADHAYRRFYEEATDAAGWRHHRLFGHPQLIQGPMELKCQLASNGVYCGDGDAYRNETAKRLEAGAADWRLLLQIDTDEEGPGWMWGDVGRIYFWIRQQDLAARHFDDVWLIFQCC